MPPPSLSEALFTIAECATSSGGAGAFGRDPGTLARAVVAVDERAEHAQGGRVARGPIVVAAELGQAGRDDAAGAEAGDADAAQAEVSFPDAGARQRQARILRERHVAQPDRRASRPRPKRGRRTPGRSRRRRSRARPRSSRCRWCRRRCRSPWRPKGAASCAPGTSAPPEGRCAWRRSGCRSRPRICRSPRRRPPPGCRSSRPVSRTPSPPTAW